VLLLKEKMKRQDDDDAVELSSIVKPLLPADDDDDDHDDTDIETTRNSEIGNDIEGPRNAAAETDVFLTQRAVAPASAATTNIADEGPEQPPTRRLRRVRVVAPSNLGPGYFLEVTCDGVDTFEVLVPEGGVRRGQEFTAQVPTPVMERWLDEPEDFFRLNVLFDCEFFCQLLMVPGIMLAAVTRRMGLNCIGRTGSPPWVRRASFLIVTLAGVLLFVLKLLGDLTKKDHPHALASLMFAKILLGGYFFLLGLCVRHAVRKKYRISGNLAADVFCVMCCSFCSLLQIFRHLKRSGNTPRVFSKPTQAQIV
jgi:Cys-rich protein (TIGR01571 family)